MRQFRHILLGLIALTTLIFGGIYVNWISLAQTQPWKYPDIISFIKNAPGLKYPLKTPNGTWRNQNDAIRWLISDITKQKVDKPLTPDREDDLRQAGATEELIQVIRANSPPLPGTQTPTPTPETPTPTPEPTPVPLLVKEIRAELVKNSSAENQTELIKKIESRKVSDTLDTANEEFFKELGATSELLEAIRKNPFVAVIAAKTPTPTPTKTPIPDPKTLGKAFANSIGMEFVFIPKGSFMRGSELVDNEKPVRQVTFAKDFYMGKFEVTQKDWREIMGDPTQKLLALEVVKESIGDTYPMVGISWFDAQAFIDKLNELNDGFVYSLPSESEWEYACRAGTTTLFAFGDKITTEQASFRNDFFPPLKHDTPEKQINKIKQVGLYQPNDWGLYDMHGNVWEWCEDNFADNYSAVRVDGSANVTKGDSTRKILRGGSWQRNNFYELRSAYRYYDNPTKNDSLQIGFRVVARPKVAGKSKK